MRRFTDGKFGELLLRSFAHRLLFGPRSWHNRVFTSSQTIEGQPNGSFIVRWPKHGEVRTRSINDLPKWGNEAHILASGPRVGRLDNIELLFQTPTACVNGSISIAEKLGVRVPYYFVSDYRFIAQKTDMFVAGVRRAEAVILSPVTLFAAMALGPGVLDGANIYLSEDLWRPFKKPRSGRRALERDSDVIMHAKHDIAFSLQLANGIFPTGTVVYNAIQVLFGLGYAELYMFGVDLNSGGRFYHESKPASTNLNESYTDAILPAFELVQEYCQRTGRTLTNCSLDSRLPATVIPKADGNKVLTRVRQNHQDPLNEAA